MVACRYTAWVRTDCRGNVVGGCLKTPTINKTKIHLLIPPTWWLRPFIIHCFYCHRLCPEIINIIWQHINVHWHFISISYLAQDVTVHFPKSWQWHWTSFSLKSVGNFQHSEVLLWRGICSTMKVGDLVNFCALYFIATHVIHTLLFLKHTNSMTFCSNSWKYPRLGTRKDFWVELASISFHVCCFHLHAFASTTLHWN